MLGPTVLAMAVFALAPPLERAERALAENRWEDAEKAYRESAVKTPLSAAALNGLGIALFKQGKKDDAVAQFNAALAADPAFKSALFNLGYAARKGGAYAASAAAYEKYAQLDPEDPDGFYGAAESHLLSGDVAKALTAYERFIAKEKRPSEQRWISRAQEQLQRLKTKSEPSAVARLPAQSALAHREVVEGDRLMQEKKYRDALFAYQSATHADPQSVQALFLLGNTYAVLGYYEQAVERWTRVAQLTSDPAIKRSAQDNITKANAKRAQAGGGSPPSQGLPPGAGPVADTTRELARKSYEQGVQHINARDFGSAVQSLTQAVILEPTLAVAYVARGSANIGLRRYFEAIEDYRYALKLDAGLASPLYGLAEAYRAVDRAADAKMHYQRYTVSTAADVRPELVTDARQKAEQLR